MIAMDPNQTTEFTLPTWQTIPEERRPMLRTRFLTAREVLRVHDLLNEWLTRKSAAAQLAAITEALTLGLVGWRNVMDRTGASRAFAVEALPDLLTPDELADAVLSMLTAVTLAEGDRKKSASPSASSLAASVADAATVIIAEQSGPA